MRLCRRTVRKGCAFPLITFYFYEAMPQIGGAASRKLGEFDGKAEPYRTVRRRSRKRGLNNQLMTALLSAHRRAWLVMLQAIRLRRLRRLILMLGVFFFAATGAVAQVAPQILKVEPPSWWAGSSLNPVRLLLRGKNLDQARVQVSGRGLRIVGAPSVNERGTYLFVDVAIAPGAAAGRRGLKITTASGSAESFF